MVSSPKMRLPVWKPHHLRPPPKRLPQPRQPKTKPHQKRLPMPTLGIVHSDRDRAITHPSRTSALLIAYCNRLLAQPQRAMAHAAALVAIPPCLTLYSLTRLSPKPSR